jgi:putative acetyltransferase
MRIDLVSLDESHFAALRQALDVVAREKRYLALTQAPDEQNAFAFYRNIISNELVFSVALADGLVAGWCDVLPTFGQARAHVGILGIVLLPAYRHRGIGRQLIEHAIARAWEKGFTRIEL